ncbi:multicopy suppressor of BFA (Brefeldin A) [Tilletia horrida]|nr:multicopy suppressor of BFA (Brefeldin A) [Tilletia horrida]
MAPPAAPKGGAKAKAPAPAAAAPVAAPAADDAAASSSTVDIVKTGGGKPDQTHHYAQLDALKEEIAKTQAELDNVRSILNGTGPSKDTPEGKRREALRTELDEIRNKQAGSKGSRGKVLDQIKSLQDSTGKRIKDLNAAKSKLQFKSPAEVDAQIARLNGQIESGTMKLVDERRAINEISNLRKAKKTYDTLAAQQASIDADRKTIDELRKTLDDPESRALSKRYDEIKAELDTIAKETEKQAGSRSKLLDQRTALSKRLTELNQARRDRQAAYRAENEKFHARVQAEREKRNERLRAEREAAADAKRKEHETQMREDAALPAFAKEIEDCDVLLNYFTNKAGLAPSQGSAASSQSISSSSRLGKPLEIRRVEPDAAGDAPQGMRVAKKKGEEDEGDFFFSGSGKKGKGKGGRGGAGGKQAAAAPAASADTTADADASTASSSSALHVPLGHLSALLALSIPPPTSTADLPRVIDNLKLKKAYFVGNQDRVTKENIAKVEKLLGKASLKDGGGAADKKSGSTDVANGEASTNGVSAASGDAIEDAEEKTVAEDSKDEPEAEAAPDAAAAKAEAAEEEDKEDKVEGEAIQEETQDAAKTNGSAAAADEDDDDDDDDDDDE